MGDDAAAEKVPPALAGTEIRCSVFSSGSMARPCGHITMTRDAVPYHIKKYISSSAAKAHPDGRPV